jgi:enoyl-CoA hydratase/3-hydroxyacyl-CoA dehydrogenase
MHFFYPPQLMRLVEVVKGNSTTDNVVLTTLDTAKKMGKDTILVRRDVPGFVVNRVLFSAVHEALWAVCRGENTFEEIDAAVRYVGGFPMGLFELFDYTGLDPMNSVNKILYRGYGERMNPSPIVESLVNKGLLGEKTKHGFYDWSGGKPNISKETSNKYDLERIYAVVVNEAAYLLSEDTASPEDIDKGMMLGTNWPKGPCTIGDEIGLDFVLQKLVTLHNKYRSERYEPSPLLEDYVKRNWTGRNSGRGFYKYPSSAVS